MAVCFEQMLANSIKSGNLLNTYFIFGDDAYLKKMYVDRIIDKTVDRDDVFNFLKFDDSASLQEVYDAKEEFPMMSDKKCVVLCDYDFEHASKSDFDKLMELLSNPVDTTVFIFWCNNLEFDFKRNDKAKKLAAATEKGGGMAVQLNHRQVSDLRKMLLDGAAKRGTSFESGAADYLIQNCGEDINVLRNELEKLCAYVGHGSISKKHIDYVSVKSIEASIYDLAREIFGKNIDKSMVLLDELFYNRTEPSIILHSIFTVFIDIYRVSAATEAGLKITDIAKDFGYGNREFVLKKAEDYARKTDKKKLKLCFDEIVAADSAFKSFASNERIILEELIVKLIYILSKGEKLDNA